MESQDILYFVLAFGALWITVFVCWFLWQIVRILKSVNVVLGTIQQQVARFEQTTEYFKAKMDHGTGHLGHLAEQMKQAVGEWKSR